MKILLPRRLRYTWLVFAVALVLAGCGGSRVTTTGVSATSEGTIVRTPQISVPTGGTSTTPATGSLGLSWTAPTTRADGTPISLSDIDGYRIYYGTSKGSHPNQVNITSGSVTSKTIGNLASGKKYYLAMTTYDNSGRESAKSPELVKQAM